MSKPFRNFYNNHICGKYHCDTCPYSWEERYYDGDADAGCFLYGELRDTCRLIRNPITQLIVNKHKNERDSRFDCYADYGKVCECAEQLLDKLNEELKRNPYYAYPMRRFIENFGEEASSLLEYIIEDYERIAHPYETPWITLKNAFKSWKDDFIWNHITCYRNPDKLARRNKE